MNSNVVDARTFGLVFFIIIQKEIVLYSVSLRVFVLFDYVRNAQTIDEYDLNI